MARHNNSSWWHVMSWHIFWHIHVQDLALDNTLYFQDRHPSVSGLSSWRPVVSWPRSCRQSICSRLSSWRPTFPGTNSWRTVRQDLTPDDLPRRQDLTPDDWPRRHGADHGRTCFVSFFMSCRHGCTQNLEATNTKYGGDMQRNHPMYHAILVRLCHCYGSAAWLSAKCGSKLHKIWKWYVT